MIRRWLPLAAVALLVTTLTLTRIGASDVCGGSEAIMGVFVQQMVENNDLLFPLDNSHLAAETPDRKFFFGREEWLLKRYVTDSHNGPLPLTLDKYLSQVVTATLERQQQAGAVAVKFEAA